MPKYRYRPKDNRTPVSHPVFGHLLWDGEYEHDECAGHPDFVEVREKQDEPDTDKPDEGASTSEPEPDSVTKSHATSAAKAGKTGGSK